jgi:hypothetical protein
MGTSPQTISRKVVKPLALIVLARGSAFYCFRAMRGTPEMTLAASASVPRDAGEALPRQNRAGGPARAAHALRSAVRGRLGLKGGNCSRASCDGAAENVSEAEGLVHASATSPTITLRRQLLDPARAQPLRAPAAGTREGPHFETTPAAIARPSSDFTSATSKCAGRRITVGEDKAYDAADHVANLRALNVTPHVVQAACRAPSTDALRGTKATVYRNRAGR